MTNLFSRLIPGFDTSCVDIAYRLGQRPGNRPILLKLKYQSAKDLIFRNTNTLKREKIYVSNDLTLEERADRKTLRDIKMGLQRGGIQAMIRSNKLLVDGQWFDVPQAKQAYDHFLRTRPAGQEEKEDNSVLTQYESQGNEMSSEQESGGQLHTQQVQLVSSPVRRETTSPPANQTPRNRERRRERDMFQASFPPLPPTKGGNGSEQKKTTAKRKSEEEKSNVQKKISTMFRPASLQFPAGTPSNTN